MQRFGKVRQVIFSVLLAAALGVVGCSEKDSHPTSVIMIGFDGMDPRLLGEMLDKGLMPNFARLKDQGSFLPLQTTTPPQSPVAWSTVITGLNPGKHGIFDFIHRDPDRYLPIDSMSKEHAGRKLPIAGYLIPLKSGGSELLRHGKPYWEYLTEAGIPAAVYRMPANFPAAESKGAKFECLTDMGTPQLAGGYGSFSYYADGGWDFSRTFSGGKAFPLTVIANRAQGKFYGPVNAFKEVENGRRVKPMAVDFSIHLDPDEPVALIEWQDQRVVLKEGEWSDWQTITFETGLPTLDVPGIARFYLKEVRPHLKFYVTPINIDPANSGGAPISYPPELAGEVAESAGRYFTQGLPEDTKALSADVLSRDEYLQQADIVFRERLKLLDFACDRFDGGSMFFYFGGSDQIGHMFWGGRKAGHPALTEEETKKYAEVMESVYVEMDRVVGKLMDQFPEATIIIMSDHGFEDFRRGFNLNTWLLENGYASLIDPSSQEDYEYFQNTDWSKTRVYGVGINGLYINLIGREREGIVRPEDKRQLLEEIGAKLKAYRDPKTGEQVVKEFYIAEDVYNGPYVEIGPDAQIGYNQGYRSSWDTILGEYPKDISVDNTDAWCGDHCIATDLVPGIIVTNKKVVVESPSLLDLAPTILKEFGLSKPASMEGRPLYER